MLLRSTMSYASLVYNKTMFLNDLIENRKNKRAEKRAEEARVNALFEEFLEETKPHTPRATKHPQAALYRHAWKRAVILSFLFKDIPNSDRHYLFEKFAKIAAKKYYRVAPSNAYGTVQLKMSPEAASKLFDKEKDILFPVEKKIEKTSKFACIYIGVDDNRRYYIGQTMGAPEFRWVQHRAHNTGPFKQGAEYIKWDVLERNVELADLNQKESYFIGFYNSFENGYNDTRGNDFQAYQQGLNDKH